MFLPKYIITKICALFITDQHLTESDRAALEHMEEAFTQMSCIQGITTRLCDRGILHKAARKRVLDALMQYGCPQAASKLVFLHNCIF